MPYSISRAKEDDVNALAELERLVFKPSDGMISPRAFRYHIKGKKNLLLVAKSDASGHDLLAYCLVFIHRYSARIYSLAINPQYQKQGIGRALLNASIEEVMKKGISKIYLEVRKENEAAINLYNSLGFTISAVKPGYYDGEDDGVVMTRKLQGNH